MDAPFSKAGVMVTFYSFKGGVGRSMALANIASLLGKRLRRRAKRVLMIDWDIEAPGLHTYFPGSESPQYKEQPGLVEYFLDLTRVLSKSPVYENLISNEDPAALGHLLSIDDYIIQNVAEGVDFIRAGCFDSGYAERTSCFNWVEFYNGYPMIFRRFQQMLCARYAWCLIDSRTGLSDVVGICTKVIPEKLVVVFSPNRQSIEGALDIVRGATEYRRQSEDPRPLAVFPLPSRIAIDEHLLLETARQEYRKKFQEQLQEMYGVDQCDLSSYFDEVAIPHVSYYAFSERVAVRDDPSADTLSINKSYERFCTRLVTLDYAWESVQPQPVYLPALAPDRFVGRGEYLETLHQLISKPGTILLSGEPGCGKSTLALMFAWQAQDDFEAVVYQDCSQCSVDAIADRLADTLREQLDEMADDLPADQKLHLVKSWLNQRKSLLILDDMWFEANQDKTGDNLLAPQDLLPGPGVAVVFTSRKAVLPWVLAQQTIRIESFTKEECNALFRLHLGEELVERYQGALQEFAERVGRLPLAVAVGAGLLSRQMQPLDLATAGLTLDGLRNEVDNVADLLERAIGAQGDAERRLLLGGAVCNAQGFWLPLASEIAGLGLEDGGKAAENLVNSSLLRVFEPSRQRFQLGPLIREHMRSKIKPQTVQQTHANAVEKLFLKWETNWSECFEGLSEVIPAVQFLRGRNQRQLASNIAYRGYLVAKRTGELHIASQIEQENISFYKDLQDDDSQDCLQRSYGNQALVLLAWGRLEEALDLFKLQQAICENLDNKEGLDGLQRSYGNQALILQDWGKSSESLELLKRQESICLELDDKESLAVSYGNQASILRDRGELKEALTLLLLQDAICEDLGSKDALQVSYGNQALILAEWGRWNEALFLLAKKEAICRELGDKEGLGYCYWNWGLLARKQGDLDIGKDKLESALTVFSELEMLLEREAVEAELAKGGQSQYAGRKADNMTNATGVCFLSYSRKRADEAALLVAALRDHGVPTWQDIWHMPSAQTEEELREILSDKATASAVLLVTPEVETSDFIRNVEAPLVFERYLRKDGFSMIVVAAGGLDYGDVGRVLGDRTGSTDPSGWNMQRVSQNPITLVEAEKIAEFALSHRLAAISNQLGPGDALELALSTRTDLPIKPGSALAVDLTHRFAGRSAHPGAWEHILRGFRSIRKTIQKQLPERLIECSGPLCISGAVALGVEFMPLSRLRAVWVQEQLKFGISTEAWGLQVPKTNSGFKSETHLGKISGTDLALVVSVTHDPKTVMDDIRATFGSTVPFRAIVHVHAESRRQVTAADATDIAHLAVNALGDARSELKVRGTVHLFLAVPAGLAFMIGQLLNTVGEVQTYEHVPGQSPPYVKAVLLHPSDT